MSTTQIALTDAAQSYPLAELRRESVVKDPESPSGQELHESEAIDRETATPFLQLIVAGYSFFCAGVNDGTCE
jgi:hypothetical protein